MKKFLKGLADVLGEIFSQDSNVTDVSNVSNDTRLPEDRGFVKLSDAYDYGSDDSNDDEEIFISREDYDRVAEAMYERLARFLERYGLKAELDTSNNPHCFTVECPCDIETNNGKVGLNDAIVFKGELIDIPYQDNVQCTISLDLPILGEGLDIYNYDVLKEAIMDLNNRKYIDWDEYNYRIGEALQDPYNFSTRSIKLKGFEYLNGFTEHIRISKEGNYYCVEYSIVTSGWKVTD